MGSENSNNLQVINDLQNLEKQLIANLEASYASQTPNLEEQQRLIDQINNLSATRVNLFNTLSSMFNISQDEISKSRKDIMDKIVVAKVMENQLTNMKNIMNEMNDIKNNKLRMVEINTFYGKKYQAHTDLMKFIIKLCVILFILIFINKREYLPSSILNPLIILIVSLGLISIIYQVWDLSIRSNMDYDKYNYPAMGSSASSSSSYDNNKVFANFGSLDGWSICGDGTEFNYDKNQCIVKPAENASNLNHSSIGH